MQFKRTDLAKLPLRERLVKPLRQLGLCNGLRVDQRGSYYHKGLWTKSVHWVAWRYWIPVFHRLHPGKLKVLRWLDRVKESYYGCEHCGHWSVGDSDLYPWWCRVLNHRSYSSLDFIGPCYEWFCKRCWGLTVIEDGSP